MRQLVDTAEAILAGRGSLKAFGELLHESWLLKKTLAKGISNGLVDDLYQLALANGASGGKLLGAGGRGFLLLFVEPERQRTLLAKLSKLYAMPFAFEESGSQIIFNEPDYAER